MVTYTPIPYWMSLPWVDACAWSNTVAAIQDEDGPADPPKSGATG
jgi:hypothetical protein